ncbi:hypothetical protein [Micromonospora inositola]|uniref:Uncharacterized protein n=1 Tax=Micromonospora inositola TaxID=47865 RepID=A0A1C5J8G0_9ACTN|nr:hypothetical protein [Micromonospora inositola]SCG66336.1 hypothetical protein GA0070613_4142 [Micromonospora inositola]
MSAIASLYVLDRERAVELADLAGRTSWWARLTRSSAGFDRNAAFFEVLVEHARPVRPGYEWSGNCMLALLAYLQRRGVRLRRSDLKAESSAINRVYGETLLLTSVHKKYLDKLAPEAHREDQIRAYFEKERLGFEEAGIAAMDGLELLHDALSRLQRDEVLLLNVG